MEHILQATSGDPDQTPRTVASDLGLQQLPMSQKKDAGLIWVNYLTNCLNCSPLLIYCQQLTEHSFHFSSLMYRSFVTITSIV